MFGQPYVKKSQSNESEKISAHSTVSIWLDNTVKLL